MTQQSTLTEIQPLFVVETPPFLHRGYTVQGMMRDTAIALLPAAALSVFYFGIPALRVMALAAATCALTQVVWEYLLKRPGRVYDCTALITGLLFAFLLPAGVPWWLVIIGSVLTMVLGREIFGGLGCNPLCPPLVGWAALTIAWPVYMDPMAMNLQSRFIDPLLQVKYSGWQSLPADACLPLFLGEQLGGLGSAQIGAVLLGGLYLVARGAVRWQIPAFFLLGAALMAAVFFKYGEAMGINPANTPPVYLYFVTGSTIFAAFFLATDRASAPVAFAGMLIYGLLAGALVVLIRVFGIYPDSAPFAVLLASLFTPLLDLIRVKPFGKKRR